MKLTSPPSRTESSPHVHDWKLRLNSSDYILVRVILTSPSPRIAVWLDQGGSIHPCPIEHKILTELVAESLKLELDRARLSNPSN